MPWITEHYCYNSKLAVTWKVCEHGTFKDLAREKMQDIFSDNDRYNLTDYELAST